MLNKFQIFDSHFHIIDKRFPLVPNNGYLPGEFACDAYQDRMASYQLCGGAIVSGSFQAFDQTYLIDALAKLGPSFVGVTQLPATVTDDEICRLDKLGVRAVRFNLKRGGSEDIAQLSAMAERIYEVAGWHVELYIDSRELEGLYRQITQLSAVSIDHLGLSKSGLSVMARLAEKGVKIKATGFGRVDFNVAKALRTLYTANPTSLMFGTDLPSTRAPRPYTDDDVNCVMEALGADRAEAVLSKNALDFYRVS